MARGAFPDSHPQHLGMPGHARHRRRGRRAAEGRPDHRARRPVRRPGHRASSTRSRRTPLIVHADIDPAEISKNRRADVPIVGDCKEVIADLIAAVQAEHEHGRTGDHADWWAQLDAWRTNYPLGYDEPGRRQPVAAVRDRADRQAGRARRRIYVAGVGQHQMWAAQFIDYENPRTWINSGGAGTMGFAVPAAMGAKVGKPETHGVGHRRRRLLPDDQPGAGDLRASRASRSRSRSSTTGTSAWSGSGRRCSTTSGTPTPTWVTGRRKSPAPGSPTS